MFPDMVPLRFRDSILKCVAKCKKSSSHEAWRMAELFGYFRQTSRKSKHCVLLCFLSIAHLFFLGGPFAVFRLVIPVAIDSIDRMVFWPLPHVFNKSPKGHSIFRPRLRGPSFTNRNTFSSIILEGFAVRVFAPVQHGGPNHV